MSSASDLELLRREFDDSLAAVSEPKGLVELRNAWLSKKGGKVTGALQALRGLPAEEKPAFGQAVNVLKQHVETALKERQAELERQQTADRLSAEAVDPTLPGRPPLRPRSEAPLLPPRSDRRLRSAIVPHAFG